MKEKNNFKQKEKDLIQAMKEFMNHNTKKMNVEDYRELLNNYESAIQVYYRDLGKKEKSAFLVKEFYKRMTNEAFIKAFKKNLKKETFEKPYWFAPVVYGFIANAITSQNVSQEIIDEYTDIYDKILKKRIKKFSKETGIETPNIAKELLALVPEEDYMISEQDSESSNKFRQAYYTQRVLTKLYALVKKDSYTNSFDLDSTSQLNSIFTILFGEDQLLNTAINVLLEKKEYIQSLDKTQQKMWNLITNWALETIEEKDKKTIKKALKYYLDKRKEDDERNRDKSRRIGLSSVSEDLYPTIMQAVNEIKEKDKEKKEKYIKKISKGKKKKDINVEEELKKVKWRTYYL